jgi:tetratricopeptide (TPR) repeat protein
MSVALGCFDMAEGWEVCAAWLARGGALGGAVVAAAMILLFVSSTAAAQDVASSEGAPRAPAPASGASASTVEALRQHATETLSHGDFDRARREFEKVLAISPEDGPAERDAARAAQAAGEFEYAVEALERAHHFEHHTADPELHYLRGEALYTLGRDPEAEREHRICELEIALKPAGRMEKLWLARIYARRGYVVLADRVYESLLPPPPAHDTEVALNQADAHLLNKDWTGGARVLRRYLALDPKSVRGREMLAWALEAGEDLDGEIDVRRSLVEDQPTQANERDYGRALERAGNFRAARDAYGGALAAGGTAGAPDATLVTSYDRMLFRTTPEVTGGAELRADPQAWAWRLQTGAALPFGTRHHVAALAWHDESDDRHANQVVGANVLSESGTVTGFGVYGVLAARRGAWVLGGADGRVTSMRGSDSQGSVLLGPLWHVRAGGQVETNVPLFGFSEVNVHADLNEQWNEAPVTVEKGGDQTGALAHVFLFPQSRWVLADIGAAGRRLSLTPIAGPVPTANQFLYWGGIDFNLWAASGRIVRGESLDEKMVRRTYLNDAGVLALRHYELYTHASPNFSIALAPRESVNNGTLIIRKVLAGGRVGFDLHGGAGYDNARDHFLAQGGGSVVVAATWSTRLLASYDIARDTATGLTGTLQIAWLTLHADL